MSTGDEEKKLLDEWIDEFMKQFTHHFREMAYENLEEEMTTYPEDSPMEHVMGIIEGIYEYNSFVLRTVSDQIKYFYGKFDETRPAQ